MSAAVSRETTVPRASGADCTHNVAPRPVSRETVVRPRFGARLLLAPIAAYRRFLSPALGARCRYYPSCSAYAEQAIGELGAVRGTILAVWRVLRCNPLSTGGIDPVSERRLFSAPQRTDVRQGAESA